MRLFHRLLAGQLSIFALLAVGIEGIYVASARDGLQEQLASHSQDAATALALSLAVAPSRMDPVLTGTIVGSAFDRGFYREILVTDAHGETLVRRQLQREPTAVPDWFANLVTLESPPAHSPIAAGWQTAGEVSVASLPDFAYRKLWDITLASLTWLLALSAVGATLCAVFLRAIRRRLHVVEREIESARREADEDAVSGLFNRRGFDRRFDAVFEATTSGMLLLIEIDRFKDYNERNGYRRGDELLARIGSCLGPALPAGCFAARIGGGIYSCIAPNIGRSEAVTLARTLHQEIEASLATDKFADIEIRCGGVYFDRPTRLDILLKQAYESMLRSRRGSATTVTPYRVPAAGQGYQAAS